MSVAPNDFEKSMAEKARLEDLRRSQEQILTSEKRELWQTYFDLGKAAEQVEEVRGREFKESQKETPSSVSRREFLQWMGAASALMTTTACQRRPERQLVPYVNKPKGFTYGVPVWFASSSAQGLGLLVKTREGRPIKLEGNPDHPLNQGGLDLWTQASILDLYNPERLRHALSVKSDEKISAADLDAKVLAALREARPGAVRLLTAGVKSPSLNAAIRDFLSATGGKWHALDTRRTDPVADAYEVVAGRRVEPSLRLDRADVIVSVDRDFLGAHEDAAFNTKQFSSRRNLHKGDVNVNRLFVFESSFTTTGVAADHRAPIRPSRALTLLLGLAKAIADRASGIDRAVLNQISAYSLDRVSKETGVSVELLQAAADALWAARGRALVLASHNGADALAVQTVTAFLNQVLGADGTTLDFGSDVVASSAGASSFSELVKDLKAGAVDVLIVHGVNPAYHRPTSGFQDAVASAKLLITVASELNETAKISHYAVGESHFLESWGDSEVRRGIYSVQQPVIYPLFETRSLLECLSAWRGVPNVDAQALVKRTWERGIAPAGGFEEWWRNQLQKGAYVKNMGAPKLAYRFGAAASSWVSRASSGEMEISVRLSHALLDGAQANNAWLQEIPEPVSKVTWGNYVAISKARAVKLGLDYTLLGADQKSDVVRVKVGGRSIELPVYIQPGLHDDVAVVHLGYGRTRAGSIGTNVGANAYQLGEETDAGSFVLSGQAVLLEKTGSRYELAHTQRMFDLQGRDSDILQQATLADFLKDPQTAHPKYKHKMTSLYNEKEFVYPGHKWGMSIDLNKCTGCSACIIACYSENNVAVVGVDEVRKGRHLAWLRMDLYFSGAPESPEAAFEPMLCQHCDKAPCETVCPVLATVHGSEGTNDMIYNRCVGTRYCANNCPYKVRRFNYFGYSDALAGKVEMQEPLQMLLNPDVTVRSRGVMEKCTFCMQRIRKTVDEYRTNSGTKLPDGAVKTACQQSCPADAIVFGDLNNPESEVAQMSKKAQGFKVLEVLNTRPSVTYLPRVRNKGSVA